MISLLGPLWPASANGTRNSHDFSRISETSGRRPSPTDTHRSAMWRVRVRLEKMPERFNESSLRRIIQHWLSGFISECGACRHIAAHSSIDTFVNVEASMTINVATRRVLRITADRRTRVQTRANAPRALALTERKARLLATVGDLSQLRFHILTQQRIIRSTTDPCQRSRALLG